MPEHSAPDHIEPLLTSAECARTLRVNERYLHTLRSRDGLPYVRIGTRVLYRPADVADYIERSMRNQPPIR